MKLWNWWIRDMLDVTPNYNGNIDGFDICFAFFMTTVVGLALLLFGLLLLCGIIASKGILLLILAILGGLGYGLYKLILETAKRG